MKEKNKNKARVKHNITCDPTLSHLHHLLLQHVADSINLIKISNYDRRLFFKPPKMHVFLKQLEAFIEQDIVNCIFILE